MLQKPKTQVMDRPNARSPSGRNNFQSDWQARLRG